MTNTFNTKQKCSLRAKTIISSTLSGSELMLPGQLFDNLPKLMRTEQFAEHFRYSKATIYDWRYRGKLRGVPGNLFLTLNRRLYIRTDVFLAWLASQNPNLDGVDSEAL
jgi:hypothetical protein